MGLWQRGIIGLLFAAVGCLPLFEILKKDSFLRRGDPSRTTRQEDPVSYWIVAAMAALFALAAVMTGGAIAQDLLKP